MKANDFLTSLAVINDILSDMETNIPDFSSEEAYKGIKNALRVTKNCLNEELEASPTSFIRAHLKSLGIDLLNGELSETAYLWLNKYLNYAILKVERKLWEKDKKNRRKGKPIESLQSCESELHIAVNTPSILYNKDKMLKLSFLYGIDLPDIFFRSTQEERILKYYPGLEEDSTIISHFDDELIFLRYKKYKELYKNSKRMKNIFVTTLNIIMKEIENRGGIEVVIDRYEKIIQKRKEDAYKEAQHPKQMTLVV